jgi:transglutaminase-like putative cysteine protease
VSIQAPERPPEVDADAPSGASGADEPVVRDASRDATAPVSVLLAATAALLSAGAAGWMAAGIFRGALPRIVGLLGPIVGVGVVALSYRTKRPTVVQYLALPACALVGALLVVSSAGGGGNVAGLVAEAIRGGGISQPPVPFDPGWRFLLVVVTGLVGAGVTSLAIGLNRPKLAILLPVPLIFGAGLVQPSGATLVSTLVALVLGIGAMAVAFGADLAKEGASSGQFELRRLGRGVALLAGLAAALVALSQLGFLFPDANDDQIIPSKRPETPPPARDRELFTVQSPIQVPWRLGTLDVYRDNAWMTPPFNSARLARIPPTGAVPFRGVPKHADEATILDPPRSASGQTFTATFRVSDIEGNIVPSVMTPVAVPSTDLRIEYDPRTQGLRLPDGRPRRDAVYRVTAPLPPATDELKASPKPGPQVTAFLDVPAAPDGVAQLMVQAPTTNSFDRLQFVRNAFYQSVVAAGAGAPVDVPPSRVVEMLEGGEASPYEITAAEVLLARWAGIPARIGYGYFGGEKTAAAEQTFSIRPKQGATWLEAYFEGHGWVPIVGTPPKAKASISDKDKKDDPTIRPTKELALLVYVPIKRPSIQLFFEIVRYWLARIAPVALLGLLVVLFHPGVVKIARRARRRRWAASAGPHERVMVAYAELRDAMNDFNFGDPIHTPLEFLDDLAPDREHMELAWLTTRGLWGDLVRDLRDEDAAAAEEMAESIIRRVRRANSGLPRVIAFGSRASLRDPYTSEIPNLWVSWSLRAAAVGALRRVWRAVRTHTFHRPESATTAVVLVALAVLVAGCVQRTSLAPAAKAALPERIVPAGLGDYTFVREEDAESAYAKAGHDAVVDPGRVFSIHQADTIQGSFQVAAFKPGFIARRDEVKRDVLADLGGGKFTLTRLGAERVYALRLPEQRMLLWFPPSGRYFVLLVARQDFEGAEDLFIRLLAYGRGEDPDHVDARRAIPFDPRRGVEDR